MATSTKTTNRNVVLLILTLALHLWFCSWQNDAVRPSVEKVKPYKFGQPLIDKSEWWSGNKKSATQNNRNAISGAFGGTSSRSRRGEVIFRIGGRGTQIGGLAIGVYTRGNFSLNTSIFLGIIVPVFIIGFMITNHFYDKIYEPDPPKRKPASTQKKATLKKTALKTKTPLRRKKTMLE